MWQITKDVLEGKAVDIRSADWKPGVSLTQRFRMYDDDGYLYYEGVSDDSETEDGFAPLDDYGMPNAGCTEIRYLRDGKWATL